MLSAKLKTHADFPKNEKKNRKKRAQIPFGGNVKILFFAGLTAKGTKKNVRILACVRCAAVLHSSKFE